MDLLVVRAVPAGHLAPAILMACLLAAAGCGPDEGRKATDTAAPTAGTGAKATIPDPREVDPAAQKLDARLGAAFRALKAGQWSEARDLAAAHGREARARRGQAEYLIGMTYYRQMLYEKAVEHFLRALQLEPGFLETYFHGGYALFNVGRLTEARAALAVYARHHPEEPAVVFGQALVELEDDRADLAERLLLRAIELSTKKRASAKDPREVDADLGRYYARLGDVYVRRDELQCAKETFTRAAALRDDLPEIWSKLASVCERLGDRAGADEARRKYDELVRKRAGDGAKPR